jgi:hypothetical protein
VICGPEGLPEPQQPGLTNEYCPGQSACPSDGGAASTGREAGESLRLLGEGFDPLDGGMTWAAAGPGDHAVHRILLALEDGLDGAVWPVPHPTCNALLPSDPATGVPIKHALNHAVDDHPSAYHSRQITGCIIPGPAAALVRW